ncbi:DMT family transporter [Rhodoferax sp.]|uniref:DMT family transporter n=1 Tax=Rhodoferax sp. TaxID=50421 RepID=UPI0025F38800|nr:DMT family transporter [Rhodoferax sp.]MCM2296383.1 DMT family transporter [Rhodoferax sp.]MDD3935227.1 DMT family transporter [Rhodoferax sp.]
MTFWRSRLAGGIALIVLAALSFASLDTSTKYATQLIPVLMLLWFRYVFQAITTLALRYPAQKWQLLHTRNPSFQVLRGVLLLITTACSFFGLQYLPVGEFTAMMMLSPLVATAMSAWFLKTHVARLRWWLMSGGLIGVLLVVRPGGQVFGWALVFPVGLVASYAWFQVLTSRLSGEENPYTTHFYTGLVGAVVMSPVMLFVSWKPDLLLTYWHWFLLVGFLGTFGHLMLIRAYMRASAPVLTPYLYTQIGFATLGGWLVFSHVPDLLTWIGIAIIAASGIGNTLLSMVESRRQVSP